MDVRARDPHAANTRTARRPSRARIGAGLPGSAGAVSLRRGVFGSQVMDAIVAKPQCAFTFEGGSPSF
jgi:hypothetical protein